MKRYLIALLVFCVAVQASWSRADDRLPTVKPVRARLDAEIQKMLDAGPLRPSILISGEHYALTGRASGDVLELYWNNPAETIVALCRSLPHVSDELKPKLKAYIQKEWELAPPTRCTHMGMKGRVQREAFTLPPEKEAAFRKEGSKPGTHLAHRFKGWSFNPYNFYACWKYAEVFGGAEKILKELGPKVQKIPPKFDITKHPHVVNCYIAGFYGLQGLYKLAGETPPAEIEAWLKQALQMRVSMLDADPLTLDGREAGGFLYLVPELGDYLHANAREAVARNVSIHEEAAPYWFVARMDEITRYFTKRKMLMCEGATSHFYEPWSLFSAKAFALKEPRAELEKYLDAPAVMRGDLFYIQNLVATLEAK
jgi:hypothetical protein